MFLMKNVVRDQAGDNGGTGGSADFTKEQFDALQAEVERLRNHSKTLLDEKKVLKSQFDEFKSSFEGIDANNIKKMMEVFESSEEAKLIADGKLDEVIRKRTEKTLTVKDSLIEELGLKMTDLERNLGEVTTRYKNEKITNELRAAAEKHGVLPTAIDDVVYRGLNLFSVDDKGNIEARDANGELVKAGTKLLNPELFVKDLQDKAPHFWPQSQGAGATGNSSAPSGVNPFKKGKTYNLTEQAKIQRSDPELAAKLRKEAQASE
jgi:hypothetical protein